MFNTISWQSYWTFVALATAGYYLIVYLAFFRNTVVSVFQKNKNTQPGNESSMLQKEDQHQPTLFDQDNKAQADTAIGENEPILYACMDELNAFFENQKKTKATKSELMFGLYTIFQKYPSIRDSDYKESITNLIAMQCENICSIHLSAEELKGVWFG